MEGVVVYHAPKLKGQRVKSRHGFSFRDRISYDRKLRVKEQAEDEEVERRSESRPKTGKQAVNGTVYRRWDGEL